MAGLLFISQFTINLMENKKRVCIFIDGSNFYHCLRKDVGDISVDFQKLAMELCGKDRHLIRTYYYNAPLDNTRKQT